MAQSAKYDFNDLGGGLNEGLPATAIADREMAELYNFYTFGTKLIRRPGTTRLTISPYALQLTSVFALKESTGDWTVVVGCTEGLAKLDNQTITPIQNSEAITVAASDFPWDFHQYKDVGYALRTGVGLKRFKTDFWGNAGIAAPNTAPVLADGAAGAVEAGNYYAVYTYYNSETGVESNPSPKSLVLAHAGTTKIDWSGVLTSSTGQVNARRLYRTAPGQTGEYFFVAQIDDNFATTYTDDVILNDLGDTVSFDNGLPPDGLLFGNIWKERMFASDGTDLFFSELGLMECFAADSVISVFPDDGHQLRAIHPFGDRLLVGKTNATHFLVSSGPRAFSLQTLSDRHGMASHFATRSAEGIVLWYTGTDFARSDGTNVAIISDTKIRHFLDRVPDNRKSYVSAAILPSKSLYIVSLPLDSSSYNKIMFAYNYKTDSWAPFDFPFNIDDADQPLATFAHLELIFDTNYGQKLYGVLYDGHLYEFFSGITDFGNNINARLKTKAFSFGKEGLFKALRRVHLLASTVNRNVILKVYANGAEIKQRTVSLAQGKDWKLYNLSTLGDPEATIQLGIQYQGDTEIELDAFALEVVEFMRSMRAA